MLPSLHLFEQLACKHMFSLRCSASVLQHLQTRESSYFSKEGYEERKAKLKEEINKGYFDDFKHFRDTGGRVFPATQGIVPVSEAALFPAAKAQGPSGLQLIFPDALQQGPGHAAVVATSCRAGAQGIIDAWMKPLAEQYSHNARLQLLHIIYVDAVIFRVPPFKWVLSSSIQAGTVPQQLYHFDNSENFKRTLEMRNLLSGYVYVVDGDGSIRWRASGPPEQNDLDSILSAVSALLEDRS